MANHQVDVVRTTAVERVPSDSFDSVSDSVSLYTYNGTYIRRAMSLLPVTQVVNEKRPNPRAHQEESDGGRRDVIELSDSDASLDYMVQGLRNHVICECCHKPIRQIVF